MLYVLTLGWEWFAAAGALGLVVGFATATRGGDGRFTGGWVILLALAALAAGGAAALLGLAPGRAGLQLDIGLLAALAYFFGLPLGGGAKSLLPAPARTSAPAPAKPPPLVLRGRPRDEPPAAPQPQPAKIEEAAAAQAPAAKKHLPGLPPESLAAPRGGAPDDLTKIKGIGPKSVEKLHALGVFHYDQIAGWNIDNARWVGAALTVPGRVERGKWIQQARELIAASPGNKTSP